MSNVLNHNFHNLRLKVNKDDYWDFFINKDALEYVSWDYDFDDECLISYIDAEKEECLGDRLLQSVDGYSWECLVANEYTLNNIGFTGYDNGLFHYFRDRINNREFVQKYTNTTYIVGDTDRLKLHPVSGTSHIYDYPYEVQEGQIKLNGGFYQGFFKTEEGKYKILPSEIKNGETWNFEFVLKKEEFEKESDKTLNDKYPNNKGIFFYLGTRAENKWVYLYNDKDDECFTLGMDDYVDGGEIKKNEYLITNLLNANPDDFVTDEEIFMDDYLTYKYYDPNEYGYKKLTEDDFMLGDYVVMYDEKPRIIDEENTPSEVIGWCCTYIVEKKEVRTRPTCCSCGGCRGLSKEYNTIKTVEKRFMDGCDLFGDDYLSDIDSLEYDTDFIEEDLDISNFDFKTSEDGFLLKIRNQYYIDTDNKFLTFNRTCDGFNVNNYTSDSLVRYLGVKSTFSGNLFLLMNRTCTGYTVNTIDQLRESEQKEYNVYKDIYDNALAFRITDEGAIGYRYYTIDCDSETKTNVREGYSFDNVIKEGVWHVINVKLSAMQNTMALRFYVDGKLVFVTDEMNKLNLRALNDLYEKQEGVPFNISLGGGTQGLADTVLPNYMLDPYRVYPLEENFGGSFIGYIKSFKFYNCDKEYNQIFKNFKIEEKKWIK